MPFRPGDIVHGDTTAEDLAGEVDSEVPGAQRLEWDLEIPMPLMAWAWVL